MMTWSIKSKLITSALLLSVALEPFFAFADEMGRQVAAFGVLHATGGQDRVQAFVDVHAVVSVAGVAFSTGAKVATDSIGTISENVARSVLAFVVVRHITAFTTVAVVAVTLAIQTSSMFALASCRVTAVVWRRKENRFIKNPGEKIDFKIGIDV